MSLLYGGTFVPLLYLKDTIGTLIYQSRILPEKRKEKLEKMRLDKERAFVI